MFIRAAQITFVCSCGVLLHYKEVERRKYVRENISKVQSTEELPLLPFGLSQVEINKIVIADPTVVDKVETKYLNESLIDALFKVEGDLGEYDRSLIIAHRLIPSVMENNSIPFKETLHQRLASEIAGGNVYLAYTMYDYKYPMNPTIRNACASGCSKFFPRDDEIIYCRRLLNTE